MRKQSKSIIEHHDQKVSEFDTKPTARDLQIQSRLDQMHAQHQRTKDKIERARKLKEIQEANMYSFKPDLSKGKRGKSLKPKESIDKIAEEVVIDEDLAFKTPIKEES